jgi:hypothetical protein
MHFHQDSYWTPKAGNRNNEYEDAFAAGPRNAPEAGGYRFAIADGATVSWHPRCWAELLVQGAVDGRLDLSDQTTLAELQQEWATSVATTSLPWYAEERARQGAYAALVVLELSDKPARVWRAVAVGDSCLFHIRAGGLLTKFPLARAADFNLRPYLIGSRSDCRDIADRLAVENGDWETGDEFLLMSDALARWFLTETEAGLRPQDELARLPSPNEPDRFREWVDGLRQARTLRNDDTTLLRIAVLE